MRPALGRTRPRMLFSVVDLPAALPPSRHTISPLSTSRSIPRNTWIGPYPATTPFNLSTAPPEIRFHHRGIVPHCVEIALGNLDAMIEHHDAIADALHQSHVMLDQRNGDIERADAPDVMHQLA